MRFRAVEQPQKFAFQGEFSDYDDGEEQIYTELVEVEVNLSSRLLAGPKHPDLSLFPSRRIFSLRKDEEEKYVLLEHEGYTSVSIIIMISQKAQGLTMAT